MTLSRIGSAPDQAMPVKRLEATRALNCPWHFSTRHWLAAPLQDPAWCFLVLVLVHGGAESQPQNREQVEPTRHGKTELIIHAGCLGVASVSR